MVNLNFRKVVSADFDTAANREWGNTESGAKTNIKETLPKHIQHLTWMVRVGR